MVYIRILTGTVCVGRKNNSNNVWFQICLMESQPSWIIEWQNYPYITEVVLGEKVC